MTIAEELEPIRVWVFDQAPAEWQRLSVNGGDEDFLVHVPAHYVAAHSSDIHEEPELSPGTLYHAFFARLGVCSVHWFRLNDDSYVVIGSHA